MPKRPMLFFLCTLSLLTFGCAVTPPPQVPAVVDRDIACFFSSTLITFEGSVSTRVDLKDKEHDKIGTISKVEAETMKDGSIDWKIWFNETEEDQEDRWKHLFDVSFNDEVRNDGFMNGKFNYGGLLNTKYGHWHEGGVSGEARCTYADGEGAAKVQSEIERRKQIIREKDL